MINYKLAKEIGATHHIDHLLYKFNDDGFAMCYFTEYGWEKTENDAAHMAELERIDFNKQKPRTRTEYEKVTESIFDLRDEFESEELYTKGRGAKYSKCETWREFAHFMIENEVYRKVEVEIDERQEFVERAISEIESCNAHEPSYYGGWFEQLYEAGCRFQD